MSSEAHTTPGSSLYLRRFARCAERQQSCGLALSQSIAKCRQCGIANSELVT